MPQYSYDKGTYFFSQLDSLCMELVIQYKKAYFVLIVLQFSNLSWRHMWEYPGPCKSAFASSKTEENH